MNRKIGTTLLLLSAILILGAALRITNLDHHELGIDEANSVLIAAGTLPELFEKLTADANPPAYYLLLHLWMKAAGDGEWAVRFPSLLIGLGLVALLYVAGRRLFDGRTAALAAVIAAVSPMQVVYSQTARMYTLLPLLSLAVFLALVAAIETNRFRSWSIYAILTSITLYTHNYGLFLLPLGWAAIVWWFGTAQRSGGSEFRALRSTARSLLAAQIAAVLLYMPWFFVFLSQNDVERYHFISPYMSGTHPLLFVPLSIESFVPGGGLPPYFDYLGLGDSGIVRILAVVLAAILGAAALHRAVGGGRGGKIDPRRLEEGRIGLTALYLFVPLAAAWLVSLFQPVYLVGRYDFIAFPGFALLLSAGASRLGRGMRLRAHLPVIVGSILIAAFALTSIVPYHRGAPRRRADIRAEYLARFARPQDMVVFTGLRRAAIQYYLVQKEISLRLYSFPRSTERHMGIFDAEFLLRRPADLEGDAEELVRTAVESLGEDGTFWVVDSPESDVNRYLFDRLAGVTPVTDRLGHEVGILAFRWGEARGP